MMQKIGNAYTKVMQTIAEKRHRNVEWAKSSVTESKAITSEEALKMKVIDLIATNVPDLLQKLNGQKVGDKTLHTAGASVVEIPMSAGEKFFQLFWQPEVMMLLMLVAIYGIIAEMSHPGAIFPGVAGALALILLLYMSATLPLNVGRGGVDCFGRRVVHHRYFCADAWRFDRRRHRRFFPRRVDAVQPRAGRLSSAHELDDFGDTRHRGIFRFLRQQRHSRAVFAEARRHGNDDRQNGQRAVAD